MATLDDRETTPVPHLQSNDPLPREIWVVIFQIIVDSSTDSTRTTFTGRKHDPLLILTWVCSHWRNLAISTPSLWSKLQIQINRDSLKLAKHKESYTKLVDLWIHRSKQCPLAIVLVDLQGHRRGRRVPRNVHFLPWSISDPIVKECNRWETLHIKTSQDSEGGNYLWRFTPLKNSLTNLKSIKIQVKPRTDADGGPFIVEEQPQLTFIEGATKLRTVRLSVPELFFGSSLPFADLTTLDLVVDQKHRFAFPLPIFQCLMALNMCPNLLHAAFNCGPAGEAFSKMAPTCHLNLTELHIFETHTRSEMPGTRIFLERLTAPCLSRLLVTSNSYPPDGEPSRWDHESMHDFLSRSPRLELLCLRFPNVGQVSVGEAIKYLHRLSNLRHFTLSIFHDPQTPVEHDVLRTLFMKDDRWPLAYISRVYYWINAPQKILNITTDPLIKRKKYESGILVAPKL
ncbi:hypothetical protein NLJ89_g3004 [Agrocybe chaxingu]|uniref:F-box domain-containing protein n=1 Tax=Agrocybe chaxingu TaxID=84603 RepID=A0A9W8KBN9_9AGAR|nr:hypothetical protein NLJ89_g3004 [Agrocybe chaxingu]